MKQLFIILAMLSATAIAAPAQDAPSDCDGIKIATGPVGKGYSKMFADVKKVCGSKVAMCEVNTDGGLANLNSLSTKEADIGFAQVDTINTMKSGDESIAALQVVMPLNYNYLHVIVSSVGFNVTGDKKFGFIKGDVKTVTINQFSDLRGQRVAVVGSAQLLGRQLDRQLGYNIVFVDAQNDSAAFKMVQQGEVAAAMTVSGWPSGTVSTLNQQSNLTMVKFDAPIGEPFKVRPLNYRNLAVYNSNTLAIPNVMVSRQFSGDRLSKVVALQSCIKQNLTELKEGTNFTPGWNEVNLNSSIPLQSLKK